MGDVPHPFFWPYSGPLLAGIAVVFDGASLAYLSLIFAAVPGYFALKGSGGLSLRNVAVLFSLTGVAGSQFVRLFTQGFREPALIGFSNSWFSPVLGCLCGMCGGVFFAYLANRPLRGAARRLIYPLPAAVMLACASLLIWSESVLRAR